MPMIVLKGQEREYIFSVVESTYENMPEYGGIYIAVRADEEGLDITDIIAIGSCASFKNYQENIKSFLAGKNCTHLYLLPEFEKSQKPFSIQDLLTTEAFRHVNSMMFTHDEPMHQQASNEPIQNMS